MNIEYNTYDSIQISKCQYNETKNRIVIHIVCYKAFVIYFRENICFIRDITLIFSNVIS